MSTTVDNRIVKMEFDNKDFDPQVEKTMNTIDRLEEKLQFKKAKASKYTIAESLNPEELRGVAKAVDNITNSFKQMKMVGVASALSIVNSISSLSKQLFNAINVTPVMKGLGEYETKLGSIQTILANTRSKGTGIEDVSAALDELNTYADNTIYNFAEMTQNIGRFTAAGVGLKDSVSSIKGIANLAAMSGSSAFQASNAMYQLSQAIAAGRVALTDWNSVANAGIGGEVLQESLKETARIHGVAVDEIIAKTGSFRESLREGWITSEIMTETLSKFTGDLSEEQLKAMGYTEAQTKNILAQADMALKAATQCKTISDVIGSINEAIGSSWATTWEYIIGDINEAKALWTAVGNDLGNIFSLMAEGRNNLLKGWNELGGRNSLIEGFYNIFVALERVITSVSDAFKAVFPPLTSQKLYDLTVQFAEFTRGLVLSEDACRNISNTFKGLFSIVGFFTDIIGAVGNIIWSLVKGFGSIIVSATGVTGSIGEMIFSFRQWIKSSNVVQTITLAISKSIDSLAKGISIFIDVISTLAVAIKNSIIQFWDFLNTIPVFKDIISGLNELFNITSSNVEGFFTTLGSKMSKFISDVKSMENLNIKTFFEALLFGVENVGKGLGTIDFGKIIESIFNPVTSAINSALKPIADAFGRVWENIKNAFDNIVEYARNVNVGDVIALSISSGFLNLIATVRTFVNIFSNIGGTFNDTIGSVNDTIDDLGKVFKKLAFMINAEAMVKMAKALAILAAALAALTFLVDQDTFTSSALSFVAFAVGLKAMLTAIGKGKDTIKGLASVTVMIAGVIGAILSLKILETINLENIMPRLLILGLLLATVTGVMVYLSKHGEDTKMAIRNAVALGICISAISKAMKNLNEVEPLRALGNAIAISLLLAQLTVALNSLPDKDKASFKGAALLLSLTFVIGSLVTAIVRLGKLTGDEAIQGITMVGTVLLGLIETIKIINRTDVGSQMGTQMNKLMLSILLLAIGIKVLSKLKMSDVAKALITITPLMLIVGGISILMQFLQAKFNQDLKQSRKSVANFAELCLALSGAVLILSIAMQQFRGMSLEDAITGVLAIAGLSTIMVQVTKTARTQKNAYKTVLALSLSIAALSAIAIILGTIDKDTVIQGVAAVSAMGLVFSAMAYTFSKIPSKFNANYIVLPIMLSALAAVFAFASQISNPNAILPLAAAMGVLGIIIAGIAEAFYRIPTNFEGKKFALIATAMGVLALVIGKASEISNPEALLPLALSLTALSVCIAILAKIFSSLNFKIDILKLGLMVGVVSVMALIIGAASAISNPDTLIKLSEAAAKLSIVSLGLIAVSALIAAVPVELILAGLVRLGFVITGLLAFFSLLGWIVSWSNDANGGNSLIKAINTLGEVLGAIGKALGNIIGGFISSIGTGIMSALQSIGTGLSNFYTNGKPFFDWIKGCDNTTFSGITALVSALTTFTGGNILDKIQSAFSGESSFDTFGKGLKSISTPLISFCKQVKAAEINTEEVEKVVDILRKLVEVENGLKNHGGWFSNIEGDASLESFVEQLETFATEMINFENKLKEHGYFELNRVQNLVDVSNKLVELEKSLKPHLGFAQLMSGDSTLAGFGLQLIIFATHFNNFAEKIKEGNIDEDAVEKTKRCATMMSELEKGLKNTGGVDAFLHGDSSLQSFGQQLQMFGWSLVTYSKTVKDLNTDAVAKSSTGVQSLVDIYNSLGPTGGGLIGSLFGGSTDFGTFGYQLAAFGDAMVEYSGTIDEVNWKKVEDSLGTIRAIVALGTEISSKGTPSTYGALGVAFEGMVTTISTSLLTRMDGMKNDISLKIEEIVKFLEGETTTYGVRLKSVGDMYALFIVQGLNEGFDKYKNQPVGKLTGIAMSMLSVIPTIFGIESPSKETTEQAKYILQGYINGTEAMSSNVLNAFIVLGNAIKDQTIENRDELQAIVQKTAEIMAAETGNSIEDTLAIANTKLEDGSVKLTNTATEAIEQNAKETHAVVDAYGHKIADVVDGTIVPTLDKLQEYKSTFIEKGAEGLKNIIPDTELFSNVKALLTGEGENPLGEFFGDDSGIKDIQNEIQSATNSFGSSAGAASSIQDDFKISTDQFWKDLLEIRKNGIDKAKYQDMTMLDFQKDIAQKTKEIMETREEAAKSAMDSFEGTYGLFDEVADSEKLAPGKILQNLEYQVQSFKNYRSVMDELKEKIHNVDLWKELTEMGVEGVGNLKAINSMTQEQLDEFVELYRQRGVEADRAAEFRIGVANKEAEKSLNELYNTTDVKLDEFRTYFDGSMESITKAIHLSEEASAAAYETGSNIVQGISKGVTEDPSAVNAASQLPTQMVTKAKESAEIHSPSELFRREIGVPMVEGIAEAFLNSESIITPAVEKMFATIASYSVSNTPFYNAGETGAKNLGSGIASKDNFVKGKVQGVINVVMRLLKTKNSEYKEKGIKNIEYYGEGIYSNKTFVYNKIEEIMKEVLTLIERKVEDFTNVGKRCIDGLIAGLNSSDSRTALSVAVQNLIDAAVIGKSEEELEIESPSKVFDRIGRYVAMGFANGIDGGNSIVARASENMAALSILKMQEAADTIQEAIDSTLFNDPTIYPVVNLDDVRSKSRQISKLIPSKYPMSASNSVRIASSAMNAYDQAKASSLASSEIQNENKTSTVSFVQNNYSPKALSRIDIYRQTRNQFNAFKRQLEYV